MVNLKPYKTDYQMLPYSKFYPNALRKTAIAEDTANYARSDADFKQRHGGVVSAEKALESGVANDWKGENTLMPQLQAEMMRAGLTKSLDNLGDAMNSEGVTGETLAPGSAGEANVASELGLDVMKFQDRNRTNRENSLALAEGIMPRRTFGFGGMEGTMMEMLNKNNQNAWNQAWFADKRNNEQFKWQVGQQNTQAGVAQGNADEAAAAQKKQAMIAAGAGVAAIALIAL